MKVCLLNKETNDVVGEFNNVINWGYNFVEYNNGGRCKCYCSEDEYFTDIDPALTLTKSQNINDFEQIDQLIEIEENKE